MHFSLNLVFMGGCRNHSVAVTCHTSYFKHWDAFRQHSFVHIAEHIFWLLGFLLYYCWQFSEKWLCGSQVKRRQCYFSSASWLKLQAVKEWKEWKKGIDFAVKKKIAEECHWEPIETSTFKKNNLKGSLRKPSWSVSNSGPGLSKTSCRGSSGNDLRASYCLMQMWEWGDERDVYVFLSFIIFNLKCFKQTVCLWWHRETWLMFKSWIFLFVCFLVTLL